MRTDNGGKTAIAVLAGVVGLLALLNWYLIASPIDVSPIAPTAGNAGTPHRGNTDLATALDNKSFAQFQEVVGRPLFNPNRRPVVRDSDTAKEAAPDPSEMRLVGVMKSGNEPSRALIRFANEQTGRWLAEGEQHNGWRVRKIDTRSVVVEGSGRSHELTITGARPAPDGPAGGSESNR